MTRRSGRAEPCRGAIYRLPPLPPTSPEHDGSRIVCSALWEALSLQTFSSIFHWPPWRHRWVAVNHSEGLSFHPVACLKPGNIDFCRPGRAGWARVLTDLRTQLWGLLKPTMFSNNIYSSGVARSARLYRDPPKRIEKSTFSAWTFIFAL